MQDTCIFLSTRLDRICDDCGCGYLRPPQHTHTMHINQEADQGFGDKTYRETGCVRDIELADAHILKVAEQHELENDAGCVVWDAALVLCNYLVKQQDVGGLDLTGKRVIELGAGTGVVGLTAAALGASEVVLTDRPHLMQHLNSNIKRNTLQHVAAATPLEWGQKPLPAALQPPYDIVLCSDLVYQPDSVHQLLTSLREVSGPGTVIYASCEYREGAGLEQMWQQMPQYGLQEQLVPYTDLHEEWCSPDILVWKIMVQQEWQKQQQQQEQFEQVQQQQEQQQGGAAPKEQHLQH